MIDILSVLGLGFVTLFTSLILRNSKPELALAIQLTGISAIALLLIGGLMIIKNAINDIFSSDTINFEILNICFKSLGICFITSFSSNLCKDFGQTALSAKIETAGKITVVILSLPLIKSITQTALELIG